MMGSGVRVSPSAFLWGYRIRTHVATRMRSRTTRTTSRPGPAQLFVAPVPAMAVERIRDRRFPMTTDSIGSCAYGSGLRRVDTEGAEGRALAQASAARRPG